MISDESPRELQWTEDLVEQFWDGAERAGIVSPNSFGRQARRSIFWLIAKHLKLGGRHLDFGSGDGAVASYLIDKGFPFAIYEPSSQRNASVEAAASQSKFLHYSPDDNDQFDVVTCFEVLEHILDHRFESVCDQLARLVKVGGKIIVSTPNNENLKANMVYCPVSNSYFHRWQHVRSITKDDLNDIFTSRGFSTVCTHQLDFSDSFLEPMQQYLEPLLRGDIKAADKVHNKNTLLHIDCLIRDIDTVIGGGSNLLFVAEKVLSPA